MEGEEGEAGGAGDRLLIQWVEGEVLVVDKVDIKPLISFTSLV